MRPLSIAAAVVRARALSVVLCAGAWGCGAALPPTSGFNPTHVGLVTGRATASDGTPLDSVRISIALSNNSRGAEYAVTTTVTDRTGNFSYPVQRMFTPRTIPMPDTVRGTVRATVEKKRYQSAGREAPTLEGSALLTFVPYGQTAPPTRVDFGFPIK